MFCIRYTVDGESGVWIDSNIRGNREPMLFHSKDYANLECERLCNQYNNEGYKFFVDEFEKVLTPDPIPL